MSKALADYYGRPDSLHYLRSEPLTASQVIRATQVRGRMADGRLISGDRVTVDHGDICPCGRAGPTVMPDIMRYKDIGDDKIGCAGTIDAYITGLIS